MTRLFVTPSGQQVDLDKLDEQQLSYLYYQVGLAKGLARGFTPDMMTALNERVVRYSDASRDISSNADMIREIGDQGVSDARWAQFFGIGRVVKGAGDAASGIAGTNPVTEPLAKAWNASTGLGKAITEHSGGRTGSAAWEAGKVVLPELVPNDLKSGMKASLSLHDSLYSYAKGDAGGAAIKGVKAVGDALGDKYVGAAAKMAEGHGHVASGIAGIRDMETEVGRIESMSEKAASLADSQSAVLLQKASELNQLSIQAAIGSSPAWDELLDEIRKRSPGIDQRSKDSLDQLITEGRGLLGREAARAGSATGADVEGYSQLLQGSAVAGLGGKAGLAAAGVAMSGAAMAGTAGAAGAGGPGTATAAAQEAAARERDAEGASQSATDAAGQSGVAREQSTQQAEQSDALSQQGQASADATGGAASSAQGQASSATQAAGTAASSAATAGESRAEAAQQAQAATEAARGAAQSEQTAQEQQAHASERLTAATSAAREADQSHQAATQSAEQATQMAGSAGEARGQAEQAREEALHARQECESLRSTVESLVGQIERLRQEAESERQAANQAREETLRAREETQRLREEVEDLLGQAADAARDAAARAAQAGQAERDASMSARRASSYV